MASGLSIIDYKNMDFVYDFIDKILVFDSSSSVFGFAWRNYSPRSITPPRLYF
jgi:hypothetical protein